MDDIPRKPFKILSIDGGGIKGIVPATFLAALERISGKPIYKYFDLVVGTSTGGIVALGIALGFSADTIARFYYEYANTIFPKSLMSRFNRAVKKFFSTKYESKALADALTEMFSDQKLGDAKTRLVIPSVSSQTADVYLFKTAHHRNFRSDYKVLATEVAMSTAAAPTYFPAFTSEKGITLLDGGLWANNPILVGITEAIGFLEAPIASIRVLSLGCTSEIKHLGSKKRGGMVQWRDAHEWILHTQSEGATNQAKIIVGGDRVLRIDQRVPGGIYSIDSSEKIGDLGGYGEELARKYSGKCIDLFLKSEAELFSPFYSESSGGGSNGAGNS